MELVVRVDDEGLLESLEGLALGLEDFHNGIGAQPGADSGARDCPFLSV